MDCPLIQKLGRNDYVVPVSYCINNCVHYFNKKCNYPLIFKLDIKRDINQLEKFTNWFNKHTDFFGEDFD